MYFNGNKFTKLLFTHKFLFIFFVTNLCVKQIHAPCYSFTLAKSRTRYTRLVIGEVSQIARVFQGTTTSSHLQHFLLNQTGIWSNWQRNKVLSLPFLAPFIEVNANCWMIVEVVTVQKKIYSSLQIILKRGSCRNAIEFKSIFFLSATL